MNKIHKPGSSGAVAGGGAGGAMPPPIVETLRKIANVVGNCQSCRRGGREGEDLKCCRPENFLVCRKNISVCRKSTALGLPIAWVPRRHCRDRKLKT
jgi:hypothetical protein